MFKQIQPFFSIPSKFRPLLNRKNSFTYRWRLLVWKGPFYAGIFLYIHSISFATIDFIFVFIHFQPSTITHLIYALLYCNLHTAYNGGWKTQFAMCVPLLLNQPTNHLPSYLTNHSIFIYNFISHYTKTILKMLAKFKTHSTILIKGEYVERVWLVT